MNEIRVEFPCGPGCKASHMLYFDLAAKPYARTVQCQSCGRAWRVQRPIMLQIVEPRTVQDPGTGDFLKGDPS